MTLSLKTSLATLALCAVATALPAQAESSASSAVSDSIATSVGSISTSIKKSSNSSSKATDVAEGDYKITEVAVADKAGSARVRLQAVADATAEGELFLTLPQTVVDLYGLQEGNLVTATQRTYGVEFAANAAFFLVLKDEWYQELQARPVAM